MTPRVEDLDLKSINLNSEFEVVCPKWVPRQYGAGGSDNRPDPVFRTPVDLPADLGQCCHVQIEGEYPKLTYKLCKNRVDETRRHGWLCRAHHDAQQTQTEFRAVDRLNRAGVDRNGEWDVKPLIERLAAEVDATEGISGHKEEHLNYKEYSQWGWAFHSNPFEMDPDYEMVPEDELRSRG